MGHDTSSSPLHPEDLERVLRHLLRKDPEGLAALHRPPSDGRLSSIDTPHGPVVCVDGKRMHSTRDPMKEARRFVRRLDLAQATTAVLLGLGSGYVARALERQFRGRLVIFEPQLEVVIAAARAGQVPLHAYVVTSADRLGATLYELLNAADQGQIIAWQPSTRLAPQTYAEAVRQSRLAVERARMRSVTTQVRVEGWLDFFLENLHHLAEDVGLAQLRNGFEGRPCIICSAGPSLERNVARLAEVGDNALIIAVNTAARALAQAGVKPHAVISVESLDITPQFADLPWLDETVAFLEMTGNPAIFDLPFAHKVPFAVDTSSCSHFAGKVARGHQLPGGFCVANAAVTLAASLGCNTIVLIGQDLAYAEDRMYAKGTFFEDVRIELEDGDARMVDAESKRVIEDGSSGTLKNGMRQSTVSRAETVEAWGGGAEVTTSKDFLMFRDWFVFASPPLNERGVRTINATEGGARIPNWEELPLDAVIREFDLARPAEAETIPETLARLLAQPPSSAGPLIACLEEERTHVMELLRAGLEARALVGYDPDGDLEADQSTTLRLAAISQRVVQLMGEAPLLREAVTAPIDALEQRQELNTFTLHQAMEAPLAKLEERIASLIERLRSRLESAA